MPSSNQTSLFYNHESGLALKNDSVKDAFDHTMQNITRHNARLLGRYLEVHIWDGVDVK